jgi:hypothetical protein
MLQSLGEAIGGFLAQLPAAIRSFFTGIGQGAGVHGVLDWTCLIVGLALLLSTLRGFRTGRIVGPVLRGFIGVALMGWAVT